MKGASFQMFTSQRKGFLKVFHSALSWFRFMNLCIGFVRSLYFWDTLVGQKIMNLKKKCFYEPLQQKHYGQTCKMFSYLSTWERHSTINNKINGSCKSVLLVRFPQTHPLFHVDVFWSRSGNFCLPSKICLSAFPIFGLSCKRLATKNSRIHNVGFE